ncbi:MAG TPA: tRNA pseudouridine(55) synthase TruB [Kofleriaceae bacterium]|nr:tRNA pseudouridine(55) synthase TruB [Kofleriaceae bacterium]
MDHRLVNGILVLDKPAGTSSAAAVERVKRVLGASRAGHGGTLDPIATGVLAICLGEATKLAGYLLADDKAYEAEAILGVATDTLDRTGVVTDTRDWQSITRERIERAIAGRRGEHDQVPPMYSALKKGGVSLYKLARRGETIEREPRRVRIDRLELIALELPRIKLEIACSKGTYIRSLVADLGADLGCGAHLAELRRTKSGRFTIDQAQHMDALDPSRIIGMADVLSLPIITVAEPLVKTILAGVQHPIEKLGVPASEQFQLFDEANTLLAIAHAEDGRVIYDRVFAT